LTKGFARIQDQNPNLSQKSGLQVDAAVSVPKEAVVRYGAGGRTLEPMDKARAWLDEMLGLSLATDGLDRARVWRIG
jgi:hypothetical protein